MYTYDVSVIGGGIPGLAAACLLAKASKKVLLVDPGEGPGGALASLEDPPLRFAGGTFLSSGFGFGGAMRMLYASLGLPAASHGPEQHYQVVFPDRRITVFPDPEQTMEELRREYPRERDRIDRVYRELRSTQDRARNSKLSAHFARKRQASRFLRSCEISAELAAFFEVQARFFYGKDLAALSLADLAMLTLSPPLSLPRGFHWLAAQLRDIFTSLGGEYRSSAGWPDIQVKAGRLASLFMGGDAIHARTIILNSSWDAERALYLGIDRQAVPVGMAQTVICSSGYQPQQDTFIVTRYDDGAHAEAVDGMMPLTLTFLPPAYHEASRDELLKRAQSVIPFLDDFLRSAHDENFSFNRHRISDPTAALKEMRGGSAALRTLSKVRNLYLIQDRTYALVAGVEAAQMAVSLLT